MKERDLHSQPFKTIVVLGESHVAGEEASKESYRWVNIVAHLVTRFQGTPVILHNKGIGANSISPRSPGYATSAKPSALERYQKDVIALKPDLFILSYGLNDMRAGMSVNDFREDMARIIIDVRRSCNSVIILTSVYYMSTYDLYPPYNVGSIEATEVFNFVIGQLAKKYECLLADIWAAEGKANWVIHPDGVHANDLGHWLIGNRVFETIAVNCSGVAAKVTADLENARQEVVRTMNARRKLQDYNR